MTFYLAWSDLFQRAVGAGEISGVSSVHKFGYNADVDMAAPEDIWDGGGDYVWLSTATALEIVSDDANDAAAGTGARTVEVTYLDDPDWFEQTTTATLNGLTPVALGVTANRCYRAKVVTAGSGGTNAGNLIVRPVGGGSSVAMISAGRGQTLMAIYTVPGGKTGQIPSFYAGLGRDIAGAAEVSILARETGTTDAAWQTKELISVHSTGSTHIRLDATAGWAPIPAKTDIRVRADATDNNSPISAGFDVVLVDV